MRKSFAIGMAFAAVLAVGSFPVRAEDYDSAKLAQALSEASVSLEQGIKASEAEGKPISGKFEVRGRRASAIGVHNESEIDSPRSSSITNRARSKSPRRSPTPTI